MRKLFCVALAFGSAALFISCNLTGGIDDPKSREEVLSDAQAKMDLGDCDGAVEKLNTLGGLDHRGSQIMGWAKLCSGSAGISKTYQSLLSYSSNTNNLTVVGTLANALIPMDNQKIAKIAGAITAFNGMTAGDEKAFNIAYANIIKAAAHIAKASADNTRVRRNDIAVAACLNANCVTANGGCTGGRLTDTQDVADALTNAANAVQAFSSLGAAQTLARQLGASSDQTAAGIRCTVFNNMLTE